jgi:hypothetical protein
MSHRGIDTQEPHRFLQGVRSTLRLLTFVLSRMILGLCLDSLSLFGLCLVLLYSLIYDPRPLDGVRRL